MKLLWANFVLYGIGEPLMILAEKLLAASEKLEIAVGRIFSYVERLADEMDIETPSR